MLFLCHFPAQAVVQIPIVRAFTHPIYEVQEDKMCQYFVTTHTYSECKLQETALNNEHPGNPSTLGRLLRSIANFAPANPPADTETPAGGADVATPQPEIHVVTHTNYFQCGNAINHPSQSHKPERERYCPDAQEAQFGEVPIEVEEEGVSTLRGQCPVCVAAEATVAREMNQIKVVSIRPLKILRYIIADLYYQSTYSGEVPSAPGQPSTPRHRHSRRVSPFVKFLLCHSLYFNRILQILLVSIMEDLWREQLEKGMRGSKGRKIRSIFPATHTDF